MRSVKIMALVAMVALVFCMGADSAKKPVPDQGSAHHRRRCLRPSLAGDIRDHARDSGRLGQVRCEDQRGPADPRIRDGPEELRRDRVHDLRGQARRPAGPGPGRTCSTTSRAARVSSSSTWPARRSRSGTSSASSAAASGSWAPPATARESVFKANVVDKQHPITAGLSDFDVDDELYAKLQGDAKIQVLVSADSDWSKVTEPLVFTQNYGKGRVVYNAFGHDRKALMTPNVQKIITRGTEWVATGKVTE